LLACPPIDVKDVLKRSSNVDLDAAAAGFGEMADVVEATGEVYDGRETGCGAIVGIPIPDGAADGEMKLELAL
jgi:hypothetical protein